MDVFRSEIKVGLLILVAAILFTVGLLMVSDIRSFWDERKTLVLHFPYADGITKGSPVWYAGLEVGAVTDIRIARDEVDRIAVTVKIDPNARVKKDSRVAIRSLGMMGAKYVEISPGSPGAQQVPNGGSLEGEAPSSLSEMMETGQQIANRFAQLVQETQELIHEVRTESSIKETIQNANGLMMDMRGQVKDLRPLLKKLTAFADSLNDTGHNLKTLTGEGGQDIVALFKELRETNRDLQKRLANLETQLVQTLGQAEQGFAQAHGAAKGVRNIVAASEADIASLLKHLEETTRNLDALSEDLRDHPWKVVWKEDGEKPASKFVGTDKWREKGRIGPNGKE